MAYVARHYVKIAGCRYTPGEIIDAVIDGDKLSRLLKLGAVEAVPALADEPAGDEAVKQQSPGDGLTEEETGEEAEAPEIDVMDGIVSAAPAGEAAKGKGRRKKA